MVNTKKMNFTVPENIARELQTLVKKSKRSAFVTEALNERLEQLKREQLEKELVEGYQARRDEDAEINREWEKITLEKWE